jgi:hypothetical protein
MVHARGEVKEMRENRVKRDASSGFSINLALALLGFRSGPGGRTKMKIKSKSKIKKGKRQTLATRFSCSGSASLTAWTEGVGVAFPKEINRDARQDDEQPGPTGLGFVQQQHQQDS